MAIIRSGVISALLAAAMASTAASAATLTTIYHMNGGSTGYASAGRPLLAKNGLLYGTAYSGGDNGGGLLFSLDPVSGTYTRLQEWTTYGADGMTPAGNLLLSNKGVLYGVAEAGGAGNCDQGCGTLWSYDTVKRVYTTLYQFSGGADGQAPEAGLAFGAGQKVLYGTTVRGGNFQACLDGCGTVFAFTIATRALVTLHAFSVSDGVGPESHPLLSGGLLYGTTPSGGTQGAGTLWQLNPASNAFAVLHNFDYHVDGAYPDGELLLSKGTLYGETNAGGPTSSNDGTVFSYNLAGSAFASLYAFQGGTDGASPQGGLTLSKGILYGTSGSMNGAGQIFGFKPAKGTVSQVYQFGNNGDGALPQTGLALNGAGGFYGVTSHAPGTVFQLTP